jgi:putative polyketide hydroxylase
MFLAQHGISSVAVERLRGGSPVPRAAFFHMRTLEMFRSAGIEDQVREQSSKEFEPEGAIVLMDTLAGKVLAGLIPSLNEGVEALSPVPAGCLSLSLVSSRFCAGGPSKPERA